MPRLLSSALAATLLAGCQMGAAPPDELRKIEVTDAASRSPMTNAGAPGMPGSAYAPRPAGPEDLGAERPAFTVGAAETAPGMVIRTGHASVEVDSLDSAVAGLRAAAERLGGHVANTDVVAGREQHRTALLEVKVPAPRFDDLVAGLRPLGRVESVHITAQDVSEEYVDVTARIANARRLEERLIDLLATRTGKLQDVLNVERELARVREQIERHEGRLRYLKSRTSFSALSVALHEPLPITGNPSAADVVAEAFRRAWRNLLAVVSGGIASLGILVPLVLVGGTAVAAVRRWRRPAPAQ